MFAGTKLNLQKCEAMWLGNWGDTANKRDLFGIQWKETLRCLGIYVGLNYNEQYKYNWQDKIDKILYCTVPVL